MRSPSSRYSVVMLAGILIGVLLMSVLPAGAGDGDVMHVGTKNTGKTVTRVNTRGGLRVDNFKNGNPALILNVRDPGVTPPMLVNSDVMVEDLNADLLDGMDASAFSSDGHDHDGDYLAAEDAITFYTRQGICVSMASAASSSTGATCDSGDVAVGGGMAMFNNSECTTDIVGSLGTMVQSYQDLDDPRFWNVTFEHGSYPGFYWSPRATCADVP